jgi:SulP family sulfate permease
MTGQAKRTFRFDHVEVAGSLGDLGTLLPLAIGMIVLCDLQATSVFLLVGLFYLLSGAYFGVPTAIQPMKVIGAYAIAAGLSAQQITSAGLWMGAILLLLGLTGLIEIIRKYTPKSAVRGVQLALGVVLLTKGLKLIANEDPGLAVHSVGPVGLGLIIGVFGLILTFVLLENKKIPAALVIVALGIIAGLIFGHPLDTTNFQWGFHLPEPLPYGWPEWEVLLWVIPLVVLPQLPMTIGNAILSNTDLSHEYFKDDARRVTARAVTLSQGLANVAAFFFGGMPMCHGAGGLAAHYRFGARTAGSNIIIGGAFVVLALLFGEALVPVLRLMPLAILGVLLTFTGIQLALMIQDLEGRQDFFVVLLMLGLTLVFNLAVAFLTGIVVAYVLKTRWVKV